MKLKHINFMSRYVAEGRVGDSDTAIISITCPCEEPAKLSGDYAAVLRLEFDDVDVEGKQFYEPIRGIMVDTVCFNTALAKQVADFVIENKDKVEKIFIHCLMGQSRSVGAVVAIGECLFEDFDPLKPMFDKHNRKVASVLREEFIDRGYVPSLKR